MGSQVGVGRVEAWRAQVERCARRSGAANIDITVVSILAAHVISNIRIFDSTCVESILHGTKNHVISNIRVTLILCGRPDSCRRAV